MFVSLPWRFVSLPWISYALPFTPVLRSQLDQPLAALLDDGRYADHRLREQLVLVIVRVHLLEVHLLVLAPLP